MSLASFPVENQSAEWRQRVELAACYRLLAHYKMTDLIYTHATVRAPGEPGRFLINPYGWRWEEITASSLVKIDVGGRKIDDSPHRVNPAGFTIHSAVHLARHDAACVIHTHTRAGMAVSAMKDGLLPISQIALQYYGRLGVHDYEGIAFDLDERQRIIRDLGGYCGLILCNHGLLTVGRGRGGLQLDVLSQPCLRGAGRHAVHGRRDRHSAKGNLREGRQTI
jgi:ribulose-5-phosphate 4-epimerase/fuculose-1-phosphate aldolase